MACDPAQFGFAIPECRVLAAPLQRIVVAALTLAATFTHSASMAADSGRAPLGETVETFALPDYHGKTHSLDDYPDKLVVLAFIGTECPLAVKYAPRLRELTAEFEKQGVAFLGIDANLQDSLSEMAAFARGHGLTFPLLKDNGNKIADRLGATRTPEVFLLDRERVIRYRGRIDDQYGFTTASGYARGKPGEPYLAEAIREVLAGKVVTRPAVPADGCLIGRVATTTPHGDVTYSKHIATIIQNRCLECHRTGEVGPFALTSYEEVVGWADMIREVVESRRMPPWFADPQSGHFANDAQLERGRNAADLSVGGEWLHAGRRQRSAAAAPVCRRLAIGRT